MMIEAKKVYQLLSEFVFPLLAIEFFWGVLGATFFSGYSFYTSTFTWVSACVVAVIALLVMILFIPHVHTLKLREQTLIVDAYFRKQKRYDLNLYKTSFVVERDKKDNEIRGKKIILVHLQTKKKTEINCFPFEDSDFMAIAKDFKTTYTA